MGTDLNSFNIFPSQKISNRKKTKKWGEQVIEAAEDLALYRNPLIRQSYRNKQINYDLYNDILDTDDIERVCNPMGLKVDSFPAKMQNYPLVIPKIDVLIGEERRRRFDFQVRVINDEAISAKEKAKKEEHKKFLLNKISQENPNKKELERDIEQYKSLMTYEWQDQTERRSRHIVNYLYKTRNLKEMFSRGFEDVLLVGEEIYCVDIVSGNPVVRKCNPLNIHTLRSGESAWVDDADIILEDGYFSHGQILDDFHNELTPKHIDLIESNFEGNDNGGTSIGSKERNILLDGIIDLDNVERDIRNQFGETYDDEGNIRVMRVVWKSKRKVGKLEYFDEDGNRFEKIVDEQFKPDPTQTVKWTWINEWWEGTRIGGGGLGNSSNTAIYIKIKKRPIQYRSIHNISECHSGYVGLAYNTNVSKSKSLMDRMKPYQYLYNVFMYRTELAFAKAKGRIGKLNLAEMPDGWTPEIWMQYAEINGWLVTDSFNEAKKGSAQGKLAGQMSGSSTMIDLEMGNYIQQHVLMLQFLENQLGQIAGITKQREGQIESRETVRGVERSVSQSNLITEKYFGLHDMVKTKVLTILMETAKVAWRGNKKVLSYVTDDNTEQVFTIDANDPVMDCDAGVILTSGSNDMELMQSLKEFAHAGLQNDKLSFKEIIDIYMNPSITATRRKLEEAEIKRDKQTQDQQAQAERMQETQIAAAKEQDAVDKQHDMNKIDKEYSYKMQLESMQQQSKLIDSDRNDNGIIDELELERERTKLNVATLKSQSEKLKLDTQLAHDAKENAKKQKHEKELKKMDIKNKPASTTK